MNKIIWLGALLSAGVAGTSYAQFAKKLIPDFVNIQYAGSTGWASVGMGYEMFNQRLRAGLQYGFVPPEKGGELHMVSASVFYRPASIRIGKQWHLNPLDLGVKGSYQFGKNYFFELPSRYPPNYYWWKPALRLHLATETSVRFDLPHNTAVRSVSAYMELNTNDLYLVSYVLNNNSLGLGNIVKAGVGIRVNFK
jgi:hypothetical protein